jgi:excisionase family DNA binding protein
MAIDVLTADELGELLKLSANRILLLARRGDLPHFRVDGRIRFDADAVEDWIKSQGHGHGVFERGLPKLVSDEEVGTRAEVRSPDRTK